MTDHTPFWDQLHEILQDELSVLRTLFEKTSEIERAHQQNALGPSPGDLEEAKEALKKAQKKRFERTKSVTECSDLTLQDDYFSKWLESADDECDAATLWDQICTLTQKIDEQQGRNATLPMQMQPEEAQKIQKQRIETLEDL